MARGRGNSRGRASATPKRVGKLKEPKPPLSPASSPPPFQITPQTIAQIEQLLAWGKTGQIGKIVERLARDWVKSWKSKMGVRVGRPRKRPSDTTGMHCAAKVEGWLAVFHPGMKRKRELQKKFRNLSLVKERLIREGYNPAHAELLISNKSAFQAACAWVGKWDAVDRSPETVANYHRRYRHLVWRYVADPKGPPQPNDPNLKVRIIVDLAPYFRPAIKNPKEFS